MNELPKVIVYTDGSCDHDRWGGWAAMLSCGDNTKYIAGSEKNTTNNRMELIAVISALEDIRGSADVTIYSDSMYVINGFKLVTLWKRRGWTTCTGQPIVNRDLWERALELVQRHRLDFHWVAGHTGELGNELMDAFAKAIRRRGRKLVRKHKRQQKRERARFKNQMTMAGLMPTDDPTDIAAEDDDETEEVAAATDPTPSTSATTDRVVI